MTRERYSIIGRCRNLTAADCIVGTLRKIHGHTYDFCIMNDSFDDDSRGIGVFHHDSEFIPAADRRELKVVLHAMNCLYADAIGDVVLNPGT